MSDLVETFNNIEGVNLRALATIESLDYEIEFIRDDLEGRYEDRDLEEAHRNLIANQISADDFKEAINGSELDCQLFLYEESIVFIFPSSRYESVFVSYDRENPFPFLEIVNRATAQDI